jgi:hypothetical protein
MAHAGGESRAIGAGKQAEWESTSKSLVRRQTERAIPHTGPPWAGRCSSDLSYLRPRIHMGSSAHPSVQGTIVGILSVYSPLKRRQVTS